MIKGDVVSFRYVTEEDIDVLLTLGAGDIGTLVEPIKHILN